MFRSMTLSHPISLALRPFGAAVVLLLMAACGDDQRDYRAADAPRQLTTQRPNKPVVALVLGGGGPRGFAHIGVLKALESAGINADIVVGASVGAIIGALHADGIPADELEKMALDLNPVQFVQLSTKGAQGSGRAIETFINEKVGNKPLQSLRRPLVAVAMRQSDGQLVAFNAGNTGVAVRASSALPGRFAPTRIEGVDYVDGDEVSPVPVRVARALGADVIIAVDVSAHLSITPPEAPEHWRARDQRRARLVAEEAPLANVMIHPDLGYYADIRIAYRVKCIQVGREAAERAMPSIREALSQAQVRAVSEP